jgi:hypothetical protein
LAAWIGSVCALHLELSALLLEARSLANELHALLEVALLHKLLTFLYELLSGLHELLTELLILLPGATALAVIMVMMVGMMSPKSRHEVGRLLPGQTKLVHRTDLQTRLHSYRG